MRPLSPRQKRAISALLNGPISSLALRKKAGQLNSPDLIYRLRRYGLSIITEYFKVIDRDGKVCRPAMYRLALISRSRAIELIGLERVSGKAGTNPENEVENKADAKETITEKGGNQ